MERLFNLHVGDKRKKREQIANKYILCVDGWTSSWGRVPWILNSNSVLVKQ